jgi:hypothetical protein
VGHAITALIVRGPCDSDAARAWDVVVVPLHQGLHLVHVDHYFAAYWQARRGESETLDVPADYPATFPREGVLRRLAAALAGTAGRDQEPAFALIMTDYFGGIGDQWACAYVDGQRLGDVRRINDALRVLGVRAPGGTDEFDAVGLGQHRTPPDALDRYQQLCDDLGV